MKILVIKEQCLHMAKLELDSDASVEVGSMNEPSFCTSTLHRIEAIRMEDPGFKEQEKREKEQLTVASYNQMEKFVAAHCPSVNEGWIMPF